MMIRIINLRLISSCRSVVTVSSSASSLSLLSSPPLLSCTFSNSSGAVVLAKKRKLNYTNKYNFHHYHEQNLHGQLHMSGTISCSCRLHSASTPSTSTTNNTIGNNHSTSTKTTTEKHISSIGFSGCGFLVPYQLGVVKALQDHNMFPKFGTRSRTQQQQPPMIPVIGCSGGALTAVSICAGVSCDDAMASCLTLNEEIRLKQLTLDVLQPGFSLVDAMEPHFRKLIETAIETNGGFDQFLHHIDHGRLLRIGLADRRFIFPLGNKKAFYYVQKYRSVDDVVAACILSSFVPGITGPTAGTNVQNTIRDQSNTSIARASVIINDMLDNHCICNGTTGILVSRKDFEPPAVTRNDDTVIGTSSRSTTSSDNFVNSFDFRKYWQMSLLRQFTKGSTGSNTNRVDATVAMPAIVTPTIERLMWAAASSSSHLGGIELFWDGGLSNGFPYYDNNTLLVSPIAVTFPNHPNSITPAIETINATTTVAKTITTSSATPIEKNMKFIRHKQRYIDINADVRVHTSSDNLRTVRHIVFSSDNTVLEQKFQQGYDNACQFIKQ